MVRQIQLGDARGHLDDLIDRVRLGDEILIEDAGHPIARLVPADVTIAGTGERVPGSAAGLFTVPADFDAPLPDDILDAFER
jgi:prevent-host-death family protein